MNKKKHLSIFDPNELKVYKKMREVRDKWSLSVLKMFTKLGVKPNHLTLLSFLMFIPFLIAAKFSMACSILFLILNIFFDLMDGALARHQKNSNIRGEFYDLAADNLSFILIGYGLIYLKVIDGFWGGFYLINHLFLIIMLFLINRLGGEVFPVIRFKYFFYSIYLLLAFTSANYFDAFLVFFAVYTFVSNIFLFNRFRCLI